MTWEDELDYDLKSAIEYNPQTKGYADISRILAKHEGENDEEDWVWLVEFKDESRGMYYGGCDYTGWDCQSSLELLPFDGWQDQLRKSWDGPSTYRPTRPTDEALIEELTTQLELPR